MEPHRFELDGNAYEVSFERAPDGWVGRVRRAEDGTIQVIAFPDGPGYDPCDVRGSLIAGCEAALRRRPMPAVTRH